MIPVNETFFKMMELIQQGKMTIYKKGDFIAVQIRNEVYTNEHASILKLVQFTIRRLNQLENEN